MPVYEYECANCGSVFELIRPVNAKPPRKCPECGEAGSISKRVSAPAFQFKGSGWYVTDYAAKSRGKEKETEAAKTEGESKASSESGADAKSEDKKPKAAEKESKGAKAGKKET